MGVEFRILDAAGNQVSMAHDEFEQLKPAWQELARRSGVLVDPYGHCRLSAEQCQVVLSRITPMQLTVSGIAQLHGLLTQAIAGSHWVQVIGD